MVKELNRRQFVDGSELVGDKLSPTELVEGQVVTNCNALKLIAPDGKEYLTDVADSETLLRLVQSVPSPKAEPLKLWLAKVGNERLKDMADPALSLDRARKNSE
jgi:hypothetical protein